MSRIFPITDLRTRTRVEGSTIRSPTISAVLRSAWAAPIWMVLLPLATVDQPARGADDATVERVRAAWERRRERTKSFQYECELQKNIVKGSRYDLVGPFSGQRGSHTPKGDVILNATITFSMSGGKIAYSYEGERWNDQENWPQDGKHTAAFDGVDYKRLLETVGRMSLGGVTRDAELDSSLTHGVHQTALYMAFSPIAWLQRQAYSPEKMTVSQVRVIRDGHDCVELSIPGRHPSWRALVCVDASRGYVPLRCAKEWKGIVKRDLSIRYVPDGEVGWRVSAWNDKSFDESGALTSSVVCKVKRCSINEPLADDVFTFEFPEGAHVIERDGEQKKYFIALADGKRRYISVGQYGRPPEDEHYRRMEKRVSAIGRSTEAGRKAILAELKQYASDHPSRPLAVDLCQMTARRLFRSQRPESAVEFCRDFTGISRLLDSFLTRWAARYEGELRRSRLVGNPIKLTGKTIDGREFDWTKFLGKVVLVEFWFTGCKPCREQMPHIKKLYEAYHGRGFDIVGVSVDSDADTLREYLTKAAIPWTTIHERLGSVGSNTGRYRVRSFPTRFLVDRAGKVVSLEASGEELDRLLLKLMETQ